MSVSKLKPVIRYWYLLIWLLFSGQQLIAETATYVEIPKLSRPVTDLTDTLNLEQVDELERKLSAFKIKKGSEISVLIVPTTQPEDIAEFGIKVADLSKLGREKADDGLILIIAKSDKRLRIEVYDGLEGVIPDAIAKRIIAETITPYFKNNDFFGGINAGVDQILALVDGEPLPPPESAQTNTSQADEGGFIFLLFGGLFAGSIFSSMFGRVTGGLIAGLGSGLLAYMLLGFGIGALLIGIIVFFLTSANSGGGGGWSNGGGYGGGDYGGGSWGGGSSSSWGGGGGHASGGGASGSW